MSAKRQKNQLELAFTERRRGEAPRPSVEGTEARMAEYETESPAGNARMMEEVCERENLKQALKRVQSNKGAPGVDGMIVEELPGHLREHWLEIKAKLLVGRYKPGPVKRVDTQGRRRSP